MKNKKKKSRLFKGVVFLFFIFVRPSEVLRRVGLIFLSLG